MTILLERPMENVSPMGAPMLTRVPWDVMSDNNDETSEGVTARSAEVDLATETPEERALRFERDALPFLDQLYWPRCG